MSGKGSITHNAKYKKRKIYDMKPQDFIGNKATYDADGQIIWGEDAKGGLQMLLDVRGWGAVQKLFDSENEAIKFHDKLGAWFADAINEKLERERK